MLASVVTTGSTRPSPTRYFVDARYTGACRIAARMAPVRIPQKQSTAVRLYRNAAVSTSFKSKGRVAFPTPSSNSELFMTNLLLISFRERAHRGLGKEWLDLGKTILGNKQHVSRAKGGIFLEIAQFFHLFDIENLRRDPVIIHSSEQQNLRVFSGILEAARHCNRFGQSGFATQFILAGAAHLPVGDEIWLLEILQRDADQRLVQDFAVRTPDRFRQFRHSLAGYVDVADAAQCDKTIRLHAHALIEFRAQFELNVERVARA